MTNPRVKEVAESVISAVRRVLVDHNVSEAEYRAGIKYMMGVAEAKEMPLLLDVFLNATIVGIHASKTKGSTPAIEGPYFIEGAPFVEGKLKTYETDAHKPLVLHGSVKDENGKPLRDAVIDVWHSTPDGKYSGLPGYHGNIPLDYYRGKIRTDGAGAWRVKTTLPAAYQIPDKGPTGALLEMMGSHSWRPAHVHFKVQKDGFQPLTTQYYFEGGEWVDSDCCSGVLPALVMPKVVEEGSDVMKLDFVLEHRARAHANVP